MPESKDNRKHKKKSSWIQISIAALAVILAGLIIVMMGIVSDIQGTARVINYAGLVRGKTQRIVKLEIAGQPQDGMLEDTESFIEGLQKGNKELGLVCLKDKEFQSKMQELDNYFVLLRQEIYQVRAKNYENTQIIEMSENFFGICDEATGLAEQYSQKKATCLASLEKYITIDIVLLMLLIGYELIKAIRYAAMNRTLQNKVYLDSATGLPNKNKCEELLNDPLAVADDVGVCSFDLNNLRRINNSMGHKAGDAYIFRFATCLRQSMPSEQFIGRAGGDEFIAVTHGLNHEEMQACLAKIQRDMELESENYPDTPLSYGVGYALASDFPDSTMGELFSYADKNMYINKNHVKREEAAAEKRLDYSMLKLLKKQGSNFTDCLYCDARMDTYRVIRSSQDFFLASDGSYSGAVEQILEEQVGVGGRQPVLEQMELAELRQKMQTPHDIREIHYEACGDVAYNRLTLIPVDWAADGTLHHFLLAFETIRKSSEQGTDAKKELIRYYEQLKQSILENDSYVDALLELSDMIYTVNLTKDTLEQNITLQGKSKASHEMFLDYPLPCHYGDYCREYRNNVTQETMGSYSMVDDSTKLLKRFQGGDTHISVEFCLREENGSIRWVQKTVLMTQTVVLDADTLAEMSVVRAIVLLQDTSKLHAREEQEHARLQAAFDEMQIANRAKTNFLSRMSHDIRTPLNGIIGLLKIDQDHFEDRELVLENHQKMNIAAGHLLSLINDVLQMSKLEEGNIVLTCERISLGELSQDVLSIIGERAVEAGVTMDWENENPEICYPYVYGSPLHLRQIFLNIYGNCIKYNRPDGKVSTKLEALEAPEGSCIYRWTISDTGIGMSTEFLEHIFDPFAQEKNDARSYYQGTGLGMAIVKGLLDKMQGTIEVSSQEGVGSKFVITIPFELAPPPEQVPEEQSQKKDSINGLHLLLAEDNELNAEIAEMLLQDNGATVTVVTDGRQAVDCFKNSAPSTFDAILMDIMMPVLDGLAATRAIRTLSREDARRIPIIAMTANAFEEDAKKCLAAGMNAHLAKPFQTEKVIATIAAYCKNCKEIN